MYLVAGHLETAYSETRKNDSYRQNVLLSILKSDLLTNTEYLVIRLQNRFAYWRFNKIPRANRKL